MYILHGPAILLLADYYTEIISQRDKTIGTKFSLQNICYTKKKFIKEHK